MTDFPSTKIPHEYGPKITVPFGPVTCPDNACGHLGEPVPVLTCLGDFALRLGGWCVKCRRLACLLDMTLENLTKAGLSFLTYRQELPKDGDVWPNVPHHFFAATSFPYGANSAGDQHGAPEAEPQYEAHETEGALDDD